MVLRLLCCIGKLAHGVTGLAMGARDVTTRKRSVEAIA